ncbi:hypothetical protein C0J52_11500 [Blattella germanica]|nr:hypothetical protein C0J52_11500 [Blattella germanica]
MYLLTYLGKITIPIYKKRYWLPEKLGFLWSDDSIFKYASMKSLGSSGLNVSLCLSSSA